MQREEFKRLGVEGDWDHPYSTMDFPAEAQIAREMMKFAANGTLYRGSKPVMWSVVEKTALAEAEVEYEDYTSDTVWVKFPVATRVEVSSTANDVGMHRASNLAKGLVSSSGRRRRGRSPATARSASRRRSHTASTKSPTRRTETGRRSATSFILADKLAADVFKQAQRRPAYEQVRDVDRRRLARRVTARIRSRAMGGYDFDVPLLAGDHVTDDAGTGFVHTAPGHGREDFDIWTANARELEARGINTAIPYTVDENGAFTDAGAGLHRQARHQRQGREGRRQRGGDQGAGRGRHADRARPAQAPVSAFLALEEAGDLPQHAAMVHRDGQADRGSRRAKPGDTLRDRALDAHQGDALGAAAGREPHHRHDREPARLGDLAPARLGRADRRVRAGERRRLGRHPARRRGQRAHRRGLREGRRRRLVRGRARASASSASCANEDWQKVDDILDVWFDSGSTHAFVLEDPKHFPGLAGIKRKRDGGHDTVMYLEGSDQHRGWFQSSLLESCGTRGRAPFDVVLTHGFVLDENGRKMSKSLGNVVAPQDVIKQSGADILRMWVCASDYADDLRIGPEILKTTVETYRKLRNTHPLDARHRSRISARRTASRSSKMPELERLMLHRLAELDALVREAYADFDYKRIFAALNAFMTVDLSAFYFDIRKDALYCDPISSADAQGVPHRDRPSVPLHGDVARADAVLHRRGSLARALSVATTARCISSRFRTCRRRGATTRWPRNGARCAPCAASSPARWRSSARQAHRLVARGRTRRLRVRPGPVRRAGRCRPRRSLHHLGGDAGGRRRPGGCVPARRCARRRRRARPGRRHQMRALVEDLAGGRRRSAVSRTSRRATPRRCASGTRCRRRRSNSSSALPGGDWVGERGSVSTGVGTTAIDDWNYAHPALHSFGPPSPAGRES